jgi:hypothetical protein
MKAQDLRIGNYVINWHGKECKVTFDHYLFHYDREQGFTEDWNSYKPIGLTEDWIKKFGFITMDAEVDFMEYAKEFEEGSFRFSLYNDGGLNEANDYPFYITTTGQMKGWETEYKTEIKYVHQLQNLYYSLTGEELTINE